MRIKSVCLGNISLSAALVKSWGGRAGKKVTQLISPNFVIIYHDIALIILESWKINQRDCMLLIIDPFFLSVCKFLILKI